MDIEDQYTALGMELRVHDIHNEMTLSNACHDSDEAGDSYSDSDVQDEEYVDEITEMTVE